MMPMRRVPHKPLGEKAREQYLYERARARASNPATPAKIPTTPAKKPTKQAARTPTPARGAPKRATTPKQKSAKRRTKRAKRQDKLRREMARSIIERVNPKGYANRTIAHLTRQVRNEKNWKAECEARSIDPKDLEPPGRDTVARAAGRRRD